MMNTQAPYGVSLFDPDPRSWLGSSGEFSAQDVFGPQSNALYGADQGYPGSSMQAAAVMGKGAGGAMHWWQDRAWHSIFWLAGGWFLFHQYLKAD